MRCDNWVKKKISGRKHRKEKLIPAKATDAGAFICNGKISVNLLPYTDYYLPDLNLNSNLNIDIDYRCEQCGNIEFPSLPENLEDLRILVSEAVEKLR